MSMTASKEKELFENKPVLQAIFNLALPSVIGQIILVLYNLADTFFVGLTENSVMINAVGICMPVYTMLTAISNLFGIGGSSVISRSLGKGNVKRAKRASSFAFWGSLVVSAIYCLVILIFAKPIANVIGGNGDAELINQAASYLRICVSICGIPTVISNLLSHLLRSQGKSLHASLGIGIGGILNIALDPLFIFVICGVENAAIGAAIATGLSNVIAMVYYVVVFIVYKNKLVIDISFTKKIFKDGLIGEVLTIGLPACLMTLCENISYAILGNLMGSVDKVNKIPLTGVEVAKKVNMFAHSVVRGMSQGVLPLIGYNKASGNRKRMKKVVFTAGGISLGIAIIAAAVNIIPFSGQGLISLFLHGSGSSIGDSQQYAYYFLIMFSIGAPFSAVAYTIISFFQACGKAWRSLILALLRKGILDIPLMFIIPLIWPTYGIVAATPIADAICCGVAIVLFVYYIKRHAKDAIPLENKESLQGAQ